MSTTLSNDKDIGIPNLIELVNGILKSNIESIGPKVVERLLEEGYTKATEFNATAPQSGEEKSKVIKKTLASKQKGYIALVGDNAVYDEFGTGEEGADDGHPLKQAFGLNPYNSGPYVSTHISKTTGRHYWFYYPMRGKPYYDFIEGRDAVGYTEGIPSGKQMYNTSVYLQSIKNDVIKKTVNEYLKKPKSELE